MKCDDLKLNLSLYIDGELGENEMTAIDGHLSQCPLCRQSADDLRHVRTSLRILDRPQIPANVVSSIRTAVAARSGVSHSLFGTLLSTQSPTDRLRIWLMSYSVGAFASLVVGFSFLWLIMASGPLSKRPVGVPLYRSVPVADDGISSTLEAYSTSEQYARSRREVSSQSPSINPNGTLIRLTKLLVEGETIDDEVVVVADVYENGSAQIAEVVEPSRHKNAVDELAKALDSNPANTPFVPASFDQRSEEVRVVFRIQTVKVSIDESPRKRKASQRS